MDGSKKVIESLDSLWFFNNVLTLTTFHYKNHAAVLDEDTVEEEEPSKQSIHGVLSTDILVPRCPNFGEIAAGSEQQVVQPVKMVGFAKPTEKPKRRRRRKRSKRNVLGDLDLGFHGNLDSKSSFSEETYGYSNFQSQHYMKMPPLDDGLAMKEHLKSWAHAVAYSVR